MLVSHSHRFIYLKTIKTAGTSIEAYFEPYCRPPDSEPPQHHCDQHESPYGIVGYRGPPTNGKKWYNHMPASEVRKKVGEDIWSSYFKFCAIRNPWQKAISAFAFQQHLSNRKMPCPTLTDKLRFPLHRREQLRFLCWLRAGRQPSDVGIYAPNQVLEVDSVIRHERLEQDVEKICQHLYIPWQPRHLKSYKQGIRSQHMTAESLIRLPADLLIREAYAFEIDTFKYTGPHSDGHTVEKACT